MLWALGWCIQIIYRASVGEAIFTDFTEVRPLSDWPLSSPGESTVRYIRMGVACLCSSARWPLCWRWRQSVMLKEDITELVSLTSGEYLESAHHKLPATTAERSEREPEKDRVKSTGENRRMLEWLTFYINATQSYLRCVGAYIFLVNWKHGRSRGNLYFFAILRRIHSLLVIFHRSVWKTEEFTELIVSKVERERQKRIKFSCQ